MIAPPVRRIWLYAAGDSLEIFLFGELAAIAPLFSQIKGFAEQWTGWRGVEVISSGTTVGGMRMWLTPIARHDDPLAEGLEMITSMFEARAIAWSASSSSRVGVVGTW